MIPLPAAKIDSFNAADVNIGDWRKWEVTNLTHGDHPFHTHGFFFELLEMQWIDMVNPSTNLLFRPLWKLQTGPGPNTPPRKWKDTIRIPARLGAKGSSKSITRLLVHFDDTGRVGRTEAMGQDPTLDPAGNVTSGGWLFHCHVLEHSARGMLSFLEVRDPTNPFILLGKGKPGSSQPYLTGSGSLATGINLNLTNAPPNKLVYMVHSNFLGNIAWGGGTLVPLLNQHAFARTTDAQGNATWSSGPGQIEKFWQVVYWEPALSAWTISNALQVK